MKGFIKVEYSNYGEKVNLAINVSHIIKVINDLDQARIFFKDEELTVSNSYDEVLTMIEESQF